MESPNAVSLPKDFPDWLGPVLVKELRRGTRRGSFAVVFILAQVAMVGALLSDLVAVSDPASGWHYFTPPGLQMSSQWGFWVTAGVFLGLVVPLGGINVLRQERDGGNAELILMAGLTRWRMVRGAWLGLCLQALLLLLSFLPYLLARYFLTGGTNVPLAITLFSLLILGSATANAMAVGLSGYRSLLKRLIILVLSLPALFLTGVIAIASLGYVFHLLELDAMFGDPESLPVMLAILVLPALALCGFTTSAFLQIGRAKLRLYDPRNWEPRPSRACLVVVILSPLIFGFLGLCSMGFATVPALVIGTFINFRSDRNPEMEDLPVDGGYL